MDLHQHLRLMADYHAWALDRLYAEVDALDEADYRRDCGQFFGSIHGTLNHLLLVEHLWQARLQHTVYPASGLDQEIESDRARLKQRLCGFARGWRPFVDALDPATLAGDLSYRSLQGQDYRLPYASLVLHVFNHATHHRGQASIGLLQLGRQAPVMDLPFFLNELPAHTLHAA
ncbi:DinB family protein [Tahibacter harae]|uniref:DinB family protein n=1 Tax=Tahibacter harae TaxID=2963937 RepID=A0ABT1QQD8_9GAMM|nr:DinB family protein [Tahibacter harae]MCQ4164477.1 DinB family protein [Tahibacter harae]